MDKAQIHHGPNTETNNCLYAFTPMSSSAQTLHSPNPHGRLFGLCKETHPCTESSFKPYTDSRPWLTKQSNLEPSCCETTVLHTTIWLSDIQNFYSTLHLLYSKTGRQIKIKQMFYFIFYYYF